MKYLILLTFLVSSILLAKDSKLKIDKAWVVSDNGLTMRDKPSTSGNKIATIPFLSVVELLKEKKFKPAETRTETINYSNCKRVNEVEESNPVEFKFGKQYGIWQKVKFKKQLGWVFSGWLHHYSETLIPHLHFLNNIPAKFYYAKDKVKGVLSFDCSKGLDLIHINKLYKPSIKFEKKQASEIKYQTSKIYQILGIKWDKNKLIISTKINKDLEEIIIETLGKKYYIMRKNYPKLEIFPIRDYKGDINIDCEDEMD